MQNTLRNNFKPLSIITLFLVFSLFLNIHTVNAKETIKPNSYDISKYEELYDIEIDEDSCIELYDGTDATVAYFYQLCPKGYIILEKETLELIEYTTENNHKYFKNSNDKYYYSGPLTSFKSNPNGDIVDLTNSKKIKKSSIKNNLFGTTFKTDNQNSTNQNNTSNNLLSQSTNSTIAAKASSNNTPIVTITPIYSNSYDNNGSCRTVELRYNTRAYKYNPNGICGSTASAIYFAYFYDHFNTKYVSSSYIDSTGKNLTLLLKSYIEPKADGTNYKELKDGINSYLKSKNLSQNATYTTSSYQTKIESILDSGKPCIIGLTGHPSYKEHWVVATGYSRRIEPYNGTVSPPASIVYIINDGWGSRNVYINKKYVDGVVYMK